MISTPLQRNAEKHRTRRTQNKHPLFAVGGALEGMGEVLVVVQDSHPANLAQLEAEPSACSLPVFMRTGLCLLEVSDPRVELQIEVDAPLCLASRSVRCACIDRRCTCRRASPFVLAATADSPAFCWAAQPWRLIKPHSLC